MQTKSSESEVLAMVQSGELALTASIQVDGFRKAVASQLPSVKEWIANEVRGLTRLTSEGFLQARHTAWYLRREGEVYGPLSHQAVLRLSSTLLADDEVFSLVARARFVPSDLLERKPRLEIVKAA